MLVKDEKNNEIEIEVSGKYSDDIQIDSAEYVDETLGEVMEETIDYILDNYQDTLYEKWIDLQVMRAESIWEGER